MTDIVKLFPGVRALKGVQLKVRPGTVHTLMGENGAGKSTLMKCLIGIHPPTSGKIVFEGKEVHFKNTLEALNAGISMIHQELSPVPERSVCENLWLGRAPRKGLIVDHKKMRQDSIELFQKLGLDLDPDEKIGNLTEKDAVLSLDGGTPMSLRDGDEIAVRKSVYKTVLAHVGEKSFYDIAFEKLGERT